MHSFFIRHRRGKDGASRYSRYENSFCPVGDKAISTRDPWGWRERERERERIYIFGGKQLIDRIGPRGRAVLILFAGK